MTDWSSSFTNSCQGSLSKVHPTVIVSKPVCRQAHQHHMWLWQRYCGQGAAKLTKDTTLAMLAGVICTFPPRGGVGSITVRVEDLMQLQPDEMLNDTCIEFFLKHRFAWGPLFDGTLLEPTSRYIESRLSADVQQRFHIFSPFFFTKLLEKHSGLAGCTLIAEEDHNLVKRWTKNVDLFSKDYIVVPINGQQHWSLVIICHPGSIATWIQENLLPAVGAQQACGVLQDATCVKPLMLHLNSMEGTHDSQAIFAVLRGYLALEWQCKMTDEGLDSVPRSCKERLAAADINMPDFGLYWSEVPGTSMAERIPSQNNTVDCGLFLLCYVDFFMSANPRCVLSKGSSAPDVRALDPRPEAADASTFMCKTWFLPSNASLLRDYMRVRIMMLMSDTLPPEDKRREVLGFLVEEYNKKPEEIGQRYLHPVEYLENLRKAAAHAAVLDAS
ncbi:hypothetical protein VOLCADRAFT_99390 [Volvox carteri f. nagariensis]|uniref:Ubiquitin-like protease family profile domain-containing protein n=1 Tax=Volvox carteri f. nagariensis TaxID=3068 RepID=D8UHP7_VOLCA|nr:uncharacterized protein VOLCADRAFT_99390 [Volvox carteri f. nagariensis]EFJ40743.1 hypothetical protein VOLCADRAFT_99390 [Volvox carteri f. nagariensis]|eukprot:XP_002958209.1 hypothetical protein VOLCADRAFT_99390 [Volvox carteri f. nagariensis]